MMMLISSVKKVWKLPFLTAKCTQHAFLPILGHFKCRTAPSLRSYPCPAVCRALSFPRPPQCPGLGHPPCAALPQALAACVHALLGSQTTRGGSGWPGGWDKDHMKFPTLPHPIRKQAEGDGARMRLRGTLGKDSEEPRGSRVTEELQTGALRWRNTTALKQCFQLFFIPELFLTSGSDFKDALGWKDYLRLRLLLYF